MTDTYWGSPRGVTTQDHWTRLLWSLSGWFALPIGALVIILIGFALFRYRERPDRPRVPAQFQYHIPIEATYTIIPLVLVAVIFGYMYGIENKLTKVSKNPGIVINVQAFQWGWRFTYPNGHEEVGSVATQPNINDEKSLPTLYMPIHTTVQINLTTADVIHTFYVPEFLYNRDAVQGVKNQVDFNVTTPGVWIGECNQLCGTYHAFMRFKVDAMTKSAFASWYHSQKPNSITYAGESTK